VYGVYNDYESDYRGDYLLSIAIEENNGEAFNWNPEKHENKVFQVDTTDEQGIFKTWSKIWKQEETGLIERAWKIQPKAQMEKLRFI